MGSQERLLGYDEDDDYTVKDEQDESTLHVQKQKRLWSSWIKRLSAGVFVIVAVASITILWLHASSYTRGLSSKLHAECNCGTSASEAKANGCRFDPYGATWLPKRCWDGELFEMFELLKAKQRHDLSFYDWTEPSHQISIDEAGELAGDPWNITTNRMRTSQSWHYVHCIYMLMKNVRAEEIGVGISGRYLSKTHIEHCAEVLMELVAQDPHGHDATSVSAVYVYDD